MHSGIPFPNLSPEIFSISLAGFEFVLRWYPLAYIAGILLGWRLIAVALRTPRLWRDQPSLSVEQLEDLVTWAVIGVILGGRLGFVVFYQPAYYLANPVEILMVWQGGMSFHGGALGVCAAAAIWCRRNGVGVVPVLDICCLAAPAGLFLGRIANFINAELWGRATERPWGVIFPGEAAQFCPGVSGLCARHPSQLYEAVLEGLVLGALLIFLAWRRGALKRAGTLLGTFLTGYGICRFLVEFVRQPDQQFVSPDNPVGYFAVLAPGYGLTMGQVLCIPMILVGVVLVLRARESRTAQP